MTYRAVCSLVLASILISGCHSKPDAEAIQGTWKVTHFEETGKGLPINGSYIFMDGKVIMKIEGEIVSEGYYQLDSSKEPKQIDFNFGGEYAPGIYKLEGNDLTICAPAYAAATPRPKEFKAPAGSSMMLIELKRVLN
jgi:uncharacterized protein (TIGR03067 family)